MSKSWLDLGSIAAEEHQLQQLETATSKNVGCFTGPAGSGKAQPLDAKVLTPLGWKLMGEIAPGDFVIGANGLPVLVKSVFPQGKKEIFRITMSDGSSTECCDEHLWFTRTSLERCEKKDGKVRSLSEIRKTLGRVRDSSPNHSVPMVSAVEFAEKHLPIDPYFMGQLLGNGSFRSSSPRFSTTDSFAIAECRSRMPSDIKMEKVPGDGVDFAFYSTNPMPYKKNSLKKAIESLGLWGKKSTEKFIPDVYKFASAESRIAIMNGILDSDGHCGNGGINVEYSTSSELLANDMLHIVRSVGGTASINWKIPVYTYKGQKKNGSRSYRMCISLSPCVLPFRTPVKAGKYIPRSKYIPSRRIESIESSGIKECQCISVDSSDGLYVTDDFIVTHNTHCVGKILETFKGYALVLTPTGKAASRVREFYPGCNASTVHSALRPSKSGKDGEGWIFEHNQNYPLDADLIICEEWSMADSSIHCSLMQAVRRGTKLLFVGDPERQLSPVGAGKPFLDFIRAGVPHGRLTEIHRYAGRLARVCGDIANGVQWVPSRKLDLSIKPSENFIHVESPSHQITTKLKSMIEQFMANGYSFDQIQVIAPCNTSGDLSREKLNSLLQKWFNPNGEEIIKPTDSRNGFRINDKIMCLSNQYAKIFDPTGAIDEDEKSGKTFFVANGDTGTIVARTVSKSGKKSYIICRMPGGVGIFEELDFRKDFTLSSCITGHKSQGSQWKVTIGIIDDSNGAKMVTDRAWWYTVCSRSAEIGCTLGSMSVMFGQCRTKRINSRRTFLQEEIKLAFENHRKQKGRLG